MNKHSLFDRCFRPLSIFELKIGMIGYLSQRKLDASFKLAC